MQELSRHIHLHVLNPYNFDICLYKPCKTKGSLQFEKKIQDAFSPEISHFFYSNDLAIYHGLPNNGHVKVNNGLKAAILNLIKSKFSKMHPQLKSHISFYSNGLAI